MAKALKRKQTATKKGKTNGIAKSQRPKKILKASNKTADKKPTKKSV
jgi:hypothetical protein